MTSESQQLANADFTDPDRDTAMITSLMLPGRLARAAENRSLPGRLPAAVVKPTGCTTFARERPRQTARSCHGMPEQLGAGVPKARVHADSSK
jgi:hypothetical protein